MNNNSIQTICSKCNFSGNNYLCNQCSKINPLAITNPETEDKNIPIPSIIPQMVYYSTERNRIEIRHAKPSIEQLNAEPIIAIVTQIGIPAITIKYDPEIKAIEDKKLPPCFPIAIAKGDDGHGYHRIECNCGKNLKKGYWYNKVRCPNDLTKLHIKLETDKTRHINTNFYHQAKDIKSFNLPIKVKCPKCPYYYLESVLGKNQSCDRCRDSMREANRKRRKAQKYPTYSIHSNNKIMPNTDEVELANETMREIEENGLMKSIEKHIHATTPRNEICNEEGNPMYPPITEIKHRQIGLTETRPRKFICLCGEIYTSGYCPKYIHTGEEGIAICEEIEEDAEPQAKRVRTTNLQKVCIDCHQLKDMPTKQSLKCYDCVFKYTVMRGPETNLTNKRVYRCHDCKEFDVFNNFTENLAFICKGCYAGWESCDLHEKYEIMQAWRTKHDKWLSRYNKLLKEIEANKAIAESNGYYEGICGDYRFDKSHKFTYPYYAMEDKDNPPIFCEEHREEIEEETEYYNRCKQFDEFNEEQNKGETPSNTLVINCPCGCVDNKPKTREKWCLLDKKVCELCSGETECPCPNCEPEDHEEFFKNLEECKAGLMKELERTNGDWSQICSCYNFHQFCNCSGTKIFAKDPFFGKYATDFSNNYIRETTTSNTVIDQ
jgi:hypothetical protein